MNQLLGSCSKSNWMCLDMQAPTSTKGLTSGSVAKLSNAIENGSVSSLTPWGKFLMSKSKLSECSQFKMLSVSAHLVGRWFHTQRSDVSNWPHVEAEMHLCAAGTSNGAQMLQVGCAGQRQRSFCMQVCACLFGCMDLPVCVYAYPFMYCVLKRSWTKHEGIVGIVFACKIFVYFMSAEELQWLIK